MFQRAIAITSIKNGWPKFLFFNHHVHDILIRFPTKTKKNHWFVNEQVKNVWFESSGIEVLQSRSTQLAPELTLRFVRCSISLVFRRSSPLLSSHPSPLLSSPILSSYCDSDRMWCEEPSGGGTCWWQQQWGPPPCFPTRIYRRRPYPTLPRADPAVEGQCSAGRSDDGLGDGDDDDELRDSVMTMAMTTSNGRPRDDVAGMRPC